MNDGKPIDETQAQTFAGISGNQAGLTDSVGPDHRRRSLIRGAAGIAPMVLTLRSGALAAAASGCVTVLAEGSTSSDGTFTPTSGSGSGSDGNTCVTSAASASCPVGTIGQGHIAGSLQGGKCLDINSAAVANQPVVLTSASANSSLLPTP